MTASIGNDDVRAAGKTPHKLERDIAARLKNYIEEPEVTVKDEKSYRRRMWIGWATAVVVFTTILQDLPLATCAVSAFENV